MSLVLSGKVGEQFLIGDDIVVTIAQICKGKVRLAFDAPKSLVIDRKAIREKKRNETQVTNIVEQGDI